MSAETRHSIARGVACSPIAVVLADLLLGHPNPYTILALILGSFVLWLTYLMAVKP